MSKRVLVTGAKGFIGRALCEELAHFGSRALAALRSYRIVPLCVTEKIVVGDAALSRELYSETNVRATERLAAELARALVVPPFRQLFSPANIDILASIKHTLRIPERSSGR